jgi:heptosyltransferase-2
MQEKLLVIQTAFIGDAVLSLPMIEVLSRQYPDSVIDVVAIPGTKEIFLNSPFVNEVMVFEKRGKHKSVAGILSFAGEINRKGYTKIFSPHKSFRTSLLVSLSGVKETYGFDTASLNCVYRNKIKYRKDYHEVRRDLDIIKYKSDDENWKIIPRIKRDNNAEEKAASLLKGIPGKIVAVAPGSVWETKKYPSESYIELIRLLASSGYNVALIGGKEDESLCQSIKDAVKGGVESFAGRLTLTESVFLLKKCNLLISNDSAPTHLSLMASIPVITIYCSTVPSFGFYPYHLNSISLSYTGLPCKPCGIHGLRKCPLGTFECALKLAPQEVFEKAKAMLV